MADKLDETLATVGGAASGLDDTVTSTLVEVPPKTYAFLDEIGRGGLGRIMRAKDVRTGRLVAIKEMLTPTADAAARFVREAMVTANLQHPAIVPVYEVGRWPDGKPFYAMKLVTGKPLSDVIAATPSFDARLALVPHVVAIADALAYAHDQRVIHRDLKPHNVLCGEHGETVVIDWGLARRLDDSTESLAPLPRVSAAPPGHTYVGAILGTPSYMAPEQARGERVDERADVYAIGAVLYHLLAGRPPYVAPDLDAVLDAVKGGPPPPLAPAVPADLAAIVTRAMSRERDARYPSARELAVDLRRFTSGQLVLAHHYSPRERVARFVRRNRAVLAVGAIAVAVLAVGGGFALRSILDARAVAQERLVKAYADRAGTELVAGHADRALAFALAAARLAGIDPDTRMVIGHALEQLPQVALRPTPNVVDAQFVPGDQDLLIGTNTGVVRWDPRTGRDRWRLDVADVRTVVALDRDSFAVASRSVVVIANLADGSVAARLAPQAASPITHFRADEGSRWGAVTTETTVEVLDLRAHAVVTSLPIAGAMRGPLVSPDGSALVLTLRGELGAPKLAIYDVRGKPVADLCDPCSEYASVDGGVAYLPPSSGEGRIVVADWTGHARTEADPKAPVVTLGVSGAHLVDATTDRNLEVRDVETGFLRWRAQEDTLGFATAPDRLFVLGRNAGVILFDLATGVELGSAGVDGQVILASSDGQRVAVTSRDSCASWLVQPPAISVVAPTPRVVTALALFDDGTGLSGSADGAIYALSRGSAPRPLATGPAGISSFATTDTRIVAGTDDGKTAIVDRETGKELHVTGGGYEITLAPDHRTFASGSITGEVALYDVETGEQLRVLGRVAGRAQPPTWSSDGRRVAVASSEGDATVWNVDGSVVRALPAKKGSVAAALSPDGRWLVRGGEDLMLYALDGGQDRPLVGHGVFWTVVAAFSDDGTRVMLAGLDGVQTWDVATGQSVVTISPHAYVTAARYVDQHTIVAATADAVVHVWGRDGLELLAIKTPGTVARLEWNARTRRLGVITKQGTFVWQLPSFDGDVGELERLARCRIDVDVIDGVIAPRPRESCR